MALKGPSAFAGLFPKTPVGLTAVSADEFAKDGVIGDDIVTESERTTEDLGEHITFTGIYDNDVPTINAGFGNDFIEIDVLADSYGDSINGDGGHDTILIKNGVDNSSSAISYINGGAGEDYIGVDYTGNLTGPGGDEIHGGVGNDVIEVTGAAQSNGLPSLQVYGGDGNDTIEISDSFIYDAYAQDGNDVLNITNVTTTGLTNTVLGIRGGAGNDTFNLDGTGGTLDVVVMGNNLTTEDSGEADTFNIIVDGPEDIVHLEDFTDDAGDDIYNEGTDDILIINGETFDWDILASGDISGSSTIASITNSSTTSPFQIEIKTTTGSTIYVDQLQVACFVTGTLIATPTGEAKVETLAIGDIVKTADGKISAIKWIGHREISPVFSSDNPSVHPVLIMKGAFGNGLPTADLRVSPDHAMLVDGVLVHASALVNDKTIVRELMVKNFTYYHIELENHDLVLANGTPAETFVDSDVRARFDNAAEYVELYRTTESAKPMTLPRVKSKRQLPATLREKLA